MAVLWEAFFPTTWQLAGVTRVFMTITHDRRSSHIMSGTSIETKTGLTFMPIWAHLWLPFPLHNNCLRLILHQTHRFSLWRCERVSPCHVPCLPRVCWQDFRLSVAASCKGAQDLTTHRAPCRSGEGLWPGSLAEIYGSKKDSAQQNCWDMLNLTQWCSYLSIRRPFKLNESIFIFIVILLTFLVNSCFDRVTETQGLK